jgi:hypothetical protein
MNTSMKAGVRGLSFSLLLLTVPASGLYCSTAAAAGAVTPMDQLMIKRGYTPVPVRPSQPNRLFVSVKINGRTTACLIDTGAPELIIDSLRAGGLKHIGKTATPAYGLLGRYASDLQIVQVDRVEVAGVGFTNQEAVVSNLHRETRAKTGSYIPTSSEGNPTDAVIGMSLLRNMHAWLDCFAPRLYVRLETPEAALKENMERSFQASGFVTVPVRALGSKLFAETAINGQPATFMIDTGSFASFIALDQLDAFHLSNQEQLGNFIDIGGRKTDLKYTRPASFKLGAFELKRYPLGTVNLPLLTEHNDQFKKHDLPPLVGLIGPDVLEKSAALIDCEGGRMFLMAKTAEK